MKQANTHGYIGTAKIIGTRTVSLAGLKAQRETGAQPDGSYSVTLPLPGKYCRPNVHSRTWHAKARDVKALREAAAIAVLGHGTLFIKPEISATFWLKTKRPWDQDNGIASLKGAIDGLADGRLFANDSAVTWGEIVFMKDVDSPRVVLQIRERYS